MDETIRHEYSIGNKSRHFLKAQLGFYQHILATKGSNERIDLLEKRDGRQKIWVVYQFEIRSERGDCVIRGYPATDSESIRPPNPILSGH